MSIRKIIAAAAITGALLSVPISMIATSALDAGGVAGGSSGRVTTQGGQGGWPFKM